jgi:nucleotide-binding universal stress UspA family protein
MATLCGAHLAYLHVGERRTEVEDVIRRTVPGDASRRLGDLVVRQGDPERAILEEAERQDADLIFAGALESDGFLTNVLGSLARRLARHSDRSIYLTLDRGAVEPALRTLVLATELDDTSAAMVRTMLAVARLAMARSIHFVHEYDPYARGSDDTGRSAVDEAGYEQILASARRAQLANFLEPFDLRGLAARAVCLQGRTLTETVQYAARVRGDLLVVPAPARRLGLLDRFFGHPTETLLHRLPCSVLLYRQPSPHPGAGVREHEGHA